MASPSRECKSPRKKRIGEQARDAQPSVGEFETSLAHRIDRVRASRLLRLRRHLVGVVHAIPVVKLGAKRVDAGAIWNTPRSSTQPCCRNASCAASRARFRKATLRTLAPRTRATIQLIEEPHTTVGTSLTLVTIRRPPAEQRRGSCFLDTGHPCKFLGLRAAGRDPSTLSGRP